MHTKGTISISNMKINPYDKYNSSTSQYYRQLIHYFSLNSLIFFFSDSVIFIVAVCYTIEPLYAGKLRKLRNISNRSGYSSSIS